jgi:RNA polymerase sigma-54 factor
MPLLQPRLGLKVSQRQVLTPGLMQMVSVLALNKLELKEMIDAEMVENPVLEEIDESVPMLDQVAGRRKNFLDAARKSQPAPPKDSFNEIDFGSYFQDYLDPGYRTQPEFEESDKPSFENFLSQPTTLSDHLAWQLGALTVDSSFLRRRNSSSAIWTMQATSWRVRRSWRKHSSRFQAIRVWKN